MDLFCVEERADSTWRLRERFLDRRSVDDREIHKLLGNDHFPLNLRSEYLDYCPHGPHENALGSFVLSSELVGFYGWTGYK